MSIPALDQSADEIWEKKMEEQINELADRLDERNRKLDRWFISLMQSLDKISAKIPENGHIPTLNENFDAQDISEIATPTVEDPFKIYEKPAFEDPFESLVTEEKSIGLVFDEMPKLVSLDLIRSHVEEPASDESLMFNDLKKSKMEKLIDKVVDVAMVFEKKLESFSVDIKDHHRGGKNEQLMSDERGVILSTIGYFTEVPTTLQRYQLCLQLHWNGLAIGSNLTTNDGTTKNNEANKVINGSIKEFVIPCTFDSSFSNFLLFNYDPGGNSADHMSSFNDLGELHVLSSNHELCDPFACVKGNKVIGTVDVISLFDPDGVWSVNLIELCNSGICLEEQFNFLSVGVFPSLGKLLVNTSNWIENGSVADYFVRGIFISASENVVVYEKLIRACVYGVIIMTPHFDIYFEERILKFKYQFVALIQHNPSGGLVKNFALPNGLFITPLAGRNYIGASSHDIKVLTYLLFLRQSLPSYFAWVMLSSHATTWFMMLNCLDGKMWKVGRMVLNNLCKMIWKIISLCRLPFIIIDVSQCCNWSLLFIYSAVHCYEIKIVMVPPSYIRVILLFWICKTLVRTCQLAGEHGLMTLPKACMYLTRLSILLVASNSNLWNLYVYLVVQNHMCIHGDHGCLGVENDCSGITILLERTYTNDLLQQPKVITGEKPTQMNIDKKFDATKRRVKSVWDYLLLGFSKQWEATGENGDIQIIKNRSTNYEGVTLLSIVEESEVFKNAGSGPRKVAYHVFVDDITLEFISLWKQVRKKEALLLVRVHTKIKVGQVKQICNYFSSVGGNYMVRIRSEYHIENDVFYWLQFPFYESSIEKNGGKCDFIYESKYLPRCCITSLLLCFYATDLSTLKKVEDGPLNGEGVIYINSMVNHKAFHQGITLHINSSYLDKLNDTLGDVGHMKLLLVECMMLSLLCFIQRSFVLYEEVSCVASWNGLHMNVHWKLYYIQSKRIVILTCTYMGCSCIINSYRGFSLELLGIKCWLDIVIKWEATSLGRQVWDPGVGICSFHILEDKDIFKRGRRCEDP